MIFDEFKHSNYVLAGLETFSPLVDKFFVSNNDSSFSREHASTFFDRTCNKFLHSFGASFKGRKKYDKYNQKEANLLQSCKNTGLFDKSEIVIDSGGFQISVGVLTNEEGQKLHTLYHEFLQDYTHLFDRAFVLDLVPGPNCKMFTSFDQVYEYNKKSYLKARNLSEEVRKKMIYIHHFRTPRLWDIFTNLLNTENMFESFQYHATGGIVANMASDVSIPCIIYVLPLVPLLKKCIDCGRKVLNFHILGGASFRDVFFYEVFRLHIKRIFDIDLNITFDSSSIFKGLLMGRYVHVMTDEGKLSKLDLRSNTLNLRYNNGNLKNIDAYQNCINEMCDRTHIKKVDLNGLYNDEGKFHDQVNLYSMFFVLYTYAKAQLFFRDKAPLIYQMYESKNIEDFNKEVSSITQNINSGKITKKQVAKSTCLFKSLDMLTSLDEDYCKYLVKKFLSKDEFVELLGGNFMSA